MGCLSLETLEKMAKKTTKLGLWPRVKETLISFPVYFIKCFFKELWLFKDDIASFLYKLVVMLLKLSGFTVLLIVFICLNLYFALDEEFRK